MFRRNEKLIQAEQLDRFEREMLRAVSASEEELDAVADSPDLYEKVRLRIAVDERAWAQPDQRQASSERRCAGVSPPRSS